MRDSNSFKRNLNIYLVSEDSFGKLTKTNSVIKENLKVWLNKNKMINDTIDILDARIVNIGLEFSVLVDLESNKFDILSQCVFNLKNYFKRTREVGEALFVGEIYDTLKKTQGVLDTGKIKIINKVRRSLFSSKIEYF